MVESEKVEEVGEQVTHVTCLPPAEALRSGPVSCNLSRGGNSAHRVGQLELPRTEEVNRQLASSNHQIGDELLS